MSFISDLDAKLLQLTPTDSFSLRRAVAGVHFLGRIGSGKTTAAEILARAYLRAGFGGVVSAAKPGEVALWQRYCEEEGRSKSLILFNEDEGFNFLSYLLVQQGIEGIGTVVDCLMKVLEAVKKASGTVSKKGEEPFFEESKRLLLRYAILPLYAANGSLSISDIVRFIESAPKDPSEVKNVEFQEKSFMYRTLIAATQYPKVAVAKELLRENIGYWTGAYVDTPSKTRGNMVVTITAALDRFRHGRLQRAFCDRTTIVPEMTYHGAVVVLAMPTLTWNEDGIIAQQLFKYVWQRAVLSRNSLSVKHRERPQFLWCDEAQETVNSYDGQFLGLARESKVCPVYLTQSLPTYYGKMGGDTPREDAQALVGKFGTTVFLANSCAETNEFASRVIGKVLKHRNNYSAGSSHSLNIGMSSGANDSRGDSYNSGVTGSSGAKGGGQSSNHSSGYTRGSGNNWGTNRGKTSSDSESRGYSEAMEFAYEPGDFGRMLKTGGPLNDQVVTGVWFESGHVFNSSGTNTLLARFKQR